MDDLISRQAAIRAFAEYEKRTTPLWSMAYQETLEEWIDEVTETLSDIPTIDLVHCRECEHWEMLDDDSDRGGCYYWMSVEEYKTSRADDFCSYGERRER